MKETEGSIQVVAVQWGRLETYPSVSSIDGCEASLADFIIDPIRTYHLIIEGRSF
jgi:hypothetical protein